MLLNIYHLNLIFLSIFPDLLMQYIYFHLIGLKFYYNHLLFLQLKNYHLSHRLIYFRWFDILEQFLL